MYFFLSDKIDNLIFYNMLINKISYNIYKKKKYNRMHCI